MVFCLLYNIMLYLLYFTAGLTNKPWYIFLKYKKIVYTIYILCRNFFYFFLRQNQKKSKL